MFATGEDQAGMDLGVLVSMVSVFIARCPRHVTGIKDLLEPTLDVYKQAWDSQDTKVS